MLLECPNCGEFAPTFEEAGINQPLNHFVKCVSCGLEYFARIELSVKYFTEAGEQPKAIKLFASDIPPHTHETPAKPEKVKLKRKGSAGRQVAEGRAYLSAELVAMLKGWLESRRVSHRAFARNLAGLTNSIHHKVSAILYGRVTADAELVKAMSEETGIKIEMRPDFIDGKPRWYAADHETEQVDTQEPAATEAQETEIAITTLDEWKEEMEKPASEPTKPADSKKETKPMTIPPKSENKPTADEDTYSIIVYRVAGEHGERTETKNIKPSEVDGYLQRLADKLKKKITLLELNGGRYAKQISA